MDDKTLRQLWTVGGDLCVLWAEVGAVVCLRLLKFAKGGAAAADEACLMVSEKVAVQQELQAALLAGKLGKNPVAIGAKVTSRMLQGVRANRQRLLRG